MDTAPLMNEAAAANYLGLAPTTLTRWRWASRGPRFHKLGAAVRYSVTDLNAYIEAAQVDR